MATEGFADFEGYRTWYQVVGDLQSEEFMPLVVVHGGPGATHDYLLPLADMAQAGHPVVFYDQLGNGASTHLPKQAGDLAFWTVDLFVRQLSSLLDHLGIAARHHVLGHSWGGFVAQEYALTKPTGLRSLILASSASAFSDCEESARRLRDQLPPAVQEMLQRQEEANAIDSPEYQQACMAYFRRHFCRLDPWPPPVQRSFQLVAQDPTVYHTVSGRSAFVVTGPIKEWRSRERLGDIHVPTLVVSGRHDQATPDMQEALVQGIPESEQVIFEESSHTPFWEERDRFMAVVSSWLRRLD